MQKPQIEKDDLRIEIKDYITVNTEKKKERVEREGLQNGWEITLYLTGFCN